MTQPYDITIIGCGYSGALVLSHILNLATNPLNIAIIDASPTLPRGAAYSTPRPEHLLNVRASRMSAFVNHPTHFYDWLITNGHTQFTPDNFVPRMIYGDYIESIYKTTLAQASHKQVNITRIAQTAVQAIRNGAGYTLKLESGAPIETRQLVLATGNHFNPAQNMQTRVITEPWDYAYETIVETDDPIIVIGTGLTAVDTIMSLLKVGCTNIMAISRNGWLPSVHIPPQITWDMPFDAAEWQGKRLSEMLHTIRQRIRTASAQGIPWQAVIDSYRPHTQTLWQLLSTQDQNRFMKRCLTLWNIHRHRMAEEIDTQLQAAIGSGALHIQTGRVTLVEQDGDNAPTTEIDFGTGKGGASVISNLVFNCTGPNYHASISPLLKQMTADALIETADNGYGLKSIEGHRVSANGHPPILSLGTPMVGEWLETVAVPELRGQTQVVAKLLLAHHNAPKT